MKPATSPLDRVRVASACPESWEGMTGDDRTRFCGRCRMNVYNLSGMTRSAAGIKERCPNVVAYLTSIDAGTVVEAVRKAGAIGHT